MSSYKDKYIKYKSKYLNLKLQIGGNPLDEFKKKITYSSTHCIEPTDIFKLASDSPQIKAFLDDYISKK